VLRLPIAHGEGGYTIDPRGLKALQDGGRVVFRYAGPAGRAPAGGGPTGSLDEIAGIVNEAGNVLGLMPHPERLSEAVLGGEDGRVLFESVFQAVGGRIS
jgi:phosphoribosylformylglycinamidine synthase